MREKTVTQFVGFQASPGLVERIKAAAREASIREQRRVAMAELVRKALDEAFSETPIDVLSKGESVERAHEGQNKDAT